MTYMRWKSSAITLGGFNCEKRVEPATSIITHITLSTSRTCMPGLSLMKRPKPRGTVLRILPSMFCRMTWLEMSFLSITLTLQIIASLLASSTANSRQRDMVDMRSCLPTSQTDSGAMCLRFWKICLWTSATAGGINSRIDFPISSSRLNLSSSSTLSSACWMMKSELRRSAPANSSDHSLSWKLSERVDVNRESSSFEAGDGVMLVLTVMPGLGSHDLDEDLSLQSCIPGMDKRGRRSFRPRLREGSSSVPEMLLSVSTWQHLRVAMCEAARFPKAYTDRASSKKRRYATILAASFPGSAPMLRKESGITCCIRNRDAGFCCKRGGR
mmetsp:Transcript_75620/g.235418  ORF Transcript_75620/g.235418 Transcript_75620/m.235418 type:complete len:328 (+) Transcript_75620:725-1708(+)